MSDAGGNGQMERILDLLGKISGKVDGTHRDLGLKVEALAKEISGAGGISERLTRVETRQENLRKAPSSGTKIQRPASGWFGWLSTPGVFQAIVWVVLLAAAGVTLGEVVTKLLEIAHGYVVPPSGP